MNTPDKKFGLAVEARGKVSIPQTVTIRFADGTEVSASIRPTSITNLFVQGTFQIVFNNLVDALEQKHYPP